MRNSEIEKLCTVVREAPTNLSDIARARLEADIASEIASIPPARASQWRWGTVALLAAAAVALLLIRFSEVGGTFKRPKERVAESEKSEHWSVDPDLSAQRPASPPLALSGPGEGVELRPSNLSLAVDAGPQALPTIPGKRAPRTGASVAHRRAKVAGQGLRRSAADAVRIVVKQEASSDEEAYAYLERYLASERDVAASKLRAFMDAFPKSKLVDTALYDLAQLDFRTANYGLARKWAQTLLRHGENAILVESAGYLECRISLAEGDEAQARMCLREFISRYPDTPHKASILVSLINLDPTCASSQLLQEYLDTSPNGRFAAKVTKLLAQCASQ